MQLVEPLTKLQLLEDIQEETAADSAAAENTDTTRSHILKSTHHICIHMQRNKTHNNS